MDAFTRESLLKILDENLSIATEYPEEHDGFQPYNEVVINKIKFARKLDDALYRIKSTFIDAGLGVAYEYQTHTMQPLFAY